MNIKVTYKYSIFTHLDGFMLPLTSFRVLILATWELYDIVFTKPCSSDKLSPFCMNISKYFFLYSYFFNMYPMHCCTCPKSWYITRVTFPKCPYPFTLWFMTLFYMLVTSLQFTGNFCNLLVIFSNTNQLSSYFSIL